MRLARMIPLLVLLTLSGCATQSTAMPTLTENEMAGVPETPMGMLPTVRPADATAVPTLAAVDFGAEQVVMMPEIGFRLVIPESWSWEQTEEFVYSIRDADDNTVITVGQAAGFDMDPSMAEQEILNLLVAQGADPNEVNIQQGVVGRANYIIVHSESLDACEYRYMATVLSYVVLKFDRSLCDETNNLNQTAFTILRSTIYTGPTE